MASRPVAVEGGWRMSSEETRGSAPAASPGRWKWVGAGAAGLVLTAVAVRHFAHHHPGVAASAATPTVDVQTVTQGTLVPTITVAGRVEPSATVGLTVPVAGTITVAVSAGQAVQSGQVLATVSSPALTAAVMSATANLSAQEAKLQQATTPLTGLQQRAAEADVTLAESQLATAQRALATADSPSGPYASAVQAAQSGVTYVESAASPQSVAVAADSAAWEAAEQAFTQAEASGASASALAVLSGDVVHAHLALAGAESSYRQAVAADTLAVASARAAESSALDSLTNNVAAAQANLLKAEAQMATATATASGSVLAALQQGVAAASAGVQSAMALAASATLRAPFQGTVMAVDVPSGSEIGPTSVLITFDATSEQFVGLLGATAARAAYVGREARVADGAAAWSGTVTTVLSSPNTPGLDEVVVTVPALASGSPSEPATAQVSLPSVAGILVPESALGRDGTGVFVDQVLRDRIRRTPVTVSGAEGDEAVVQGIADGSTIVSQDAALWLNGERLSPARGRS